jgi:peptidoglycan hydrolase-like protein with peptidoglycan-binding domain
MVAFATAFRTSSQMHAISDERVIDGRRVIARVAWHTYQGATGKHGLFKGGEILFVENAATPAPPAPTPSAAADASEAQALDLDTPIGVQRALNHLGTAPPLVEDGILGTATMAAIRTFQSAHGLGVDGTAGPKTQEALAAELTALDQ